MWRKQSFRRAGSLKLHSIAVFCLLLCGNALADDIVIGVLAYEGRLPSQQRWQPTADYLSERLAPHRFRIQALSHKEFEHTINKGKLDFILTNPGHYAQLQARYSASRIATFIADHQGTPLTRFSSVIFTRRDSGIITPEDMRGHRLAAVNEDAFCGYQLARHRLMTRGIDTQSDLQIIWLGFPHSDVVRAVLDGKADAGVVRSGVLEEMADEGQLDLGQIRVIAPRTDDELPLLHSTEVFPEWTFARLPDTDINLSRQVALTLMGTPTDAPAAIHAKGAGWTIPLSDTKVHTVLKELNIAPYVPEPLTMARAPGEFTYWILLIGLLLLILLATAIRLFVTNRHLQRSRVISQNSQGELDNTARHYSVQLERSQQALEEARRIHQQATRDADSTRDTMQALHEIMLREGLSAQHRIDAIIESVRQHIGADIGLLSRVQGEHYETRSISPVTADYSAPLHRAGVAQAIELRRIHQSTDNADWACHIACPVFVHGELHCLVEFATCTAACEEHSGPSPMELALLALITQWVAHEFLQNECQASEAAKTQAIRDRFNAITPREKDVLQLLIQGESNKIIARALGLSPKTVEMHRANLIRKTGTKSSIDLVQLSVNSGLFQVIQ